jgi:hypothetical protein
MFRISPRPKNVKRSASVWIALAIVLILGADRPVFSAENKSDLVGFSDLKIGEMIVEIERGRQYVQQIAVMDELRNELLKQVFTLNEIAAARTQQFEAAQTMIDEQKRLIDLGIQGMESRDVEIVELKEAVTEAWFKGGAFGAALGVVLTIVAIIML